MMGEHQVEGLERSNIHQEKSKRIFNGKRAIHAESEGGFKSWVSTGGE